MCDRVYTRLSVRTCPTCGCACARKPSFSARPTSPPLPPPVLGTSITYSTFLLSALSGRNVMSQMEMLLIGTVVLGSRQALHFVGVRGVVVAWRLVVMRGCACEVWMECARAALCVWERARSLALPVPPVVPLYVYYFCMCVMQPRTHVAAPPPASRPQP